MGEFDEPQHLQFAPAALEAADREHDVRNPGPGHAISHRSQKWRFQDSSIARFHNLAVWSASFVDVLCHESLDSGRHKPSPTTHLFPQQQVPDPPAQRSAHPRPDRHAEALLAAVDHTGRDSAPPSQLLEQHLRAASPELEAGGQGRGEFEDPVVEQR